MSVWKLDVVIPRRLKHHPNLIITHLVAQASRPRMNNDRNLILLQTERFSLFRRKNFLNVSDLDEVIS